MPYYPFGSLGFNPTDITTYVEFLVSIACLALLQCDVQVFELTCAIQHSESIHFSCSLLLICGFISRSAFGLMQSSLSCSTDMSSPKLSWSIYFYNIIMSINVSICMCRLTSTAMSWGMLGFLTLTMSPWQGSSLAGVERIMSPTLGTSNGPSRLHLFYFLGSLGHQLSSLLSLG